MQLRGATRRGVPTVDRCKIYNITILYYSSVTKLLPLYPIICTYKCGVRIYIYSTVTAQYRLNAYSLVLLRSLAAIVSYRQ